MPIDVASLLRREEHRSIGYVPYISLLARWRPLVAFINIAEATPHVAVDQAGQDGVGPDPTTRIFDGDGNCQLVQRCFRRIIDRVIHAGVADRGDALVLPRNVPGVDASKNESSSPELAKSQ